MRENSTSSVVTCAFCKTKNRIRSAGPTKVQAVCGNCKQPLPDASAKPTIVTDGNFTEIVGKAGVPVLLDMWAAWCGPCRMIAPTIEALAKELAGKVLVGKLDVDANQSTAAKFGVQSIPTLLILKDGREIDRLVGVQPKESILKRLQRFL